MEIAGFKYHAQEEMKATSLGWKSALWRGIHGASADNVYR